MGFVKDLANAGTFGLAGTLLNKKKKPTTSAAPSMISISPTAASPSMIGSTRGGYG